MRRIIVVMLMVGSFLSTAFAEPKEPSAQIDALMKRLQSEKIEGTLIGFFSGSLMFEQKEAQIRAMDGQAKAAIEFFGKPVSYEIVETSKMGTSLVRIKWITKHKNETPMFWNALFYHRNSKWEPLGIFFFDDPQKAGFF
jgi:hypothetical protein